MFLHAALPFMSLQEVVSNDMYEMRMLGTDPPLLACMTAGPHVWMSYHQPAADVNILETWIYKWTPSAAQHSASEPSILLAIDLCHSCEC